MTKRTRNRRICLALATPALVLAGAAAAPADTGVAADPKERGIPKNYNITQVAQGHTNGGELSHTVSVRGRYPAAFPFTSEVPSLTIDPEEVGGDVYTVQVYEDGSSDVTSGFDQTGSAIFTLMDKNTLRITFPPSAIGDPSSYTWRTNYYRVGKDDRAPNRGMYLHDLG
jgi:hypothetical protein